MHSDFSLNIILVLFPPYPGDAQKVWVCSDFPLNGLLYIFCTCTNIILVLALVVFVRGG